MFRGFWASTCGAPSGILVSTFSHQGYSTVSDNNNFATQKPPLNDYGCRAYGELSHFVYCLLQKIKASGSLPVVEKWESYMLPNHSSFTAIED